MVSPVSGGGYEARPVVELAEHGHGTPVAYFTMELAVDDGIPTYSGGLGVLAGDFLRAAADLALPVVGVTLVYHEGFFRQVLDAAGAQVEQPARWTPAERLERLDTRVAVTVAGRPVTVGAWRLRIAGSGGHEVPVYFLDTRVPENDPADQGITDHLYTGTPTDRLSQEAVLGVGGVAMLAALGHEVAVFHMNEGHAALAPVALLAAEAGPELAGATPAHLDAVRRRCVFTTHTPVPAGHDRFPRPVAESVVGPALVAGLDRLGMLDGDELNMSVLGMSLSGYVNGVAQRHGQVSQAMFPRFTVHAITNGVHVPTWAAPSTARLLDRHVANWRHDSTAVRHAQTIPLDEVRAAHAEAKQVLVDEVGWRSGVRLDPEVLTLCVARRATPYKRNDLLLSDPAALAAITAAVGPLQVVYSGKAHPLDEPGKAMIRHVAELAAELAGVVPVAYLEDYGMAIGAVLCAGADVWVNTPVAPHEASGTSGMKAALNGVPSLSILDGWWLEGHIEGVTGWAVGADSGAAGGHPVGDAAVDGADAAALYRVLGDVVAPLYYGRPVGFDEVRRAAMALNGSFFTAQRMVTEYVNEAYRLGVAASGQG